MTQVRVGESHCVVGRDLLAAVLRRYGNLRRFHRERLAGRVSYYRIRRAAAGDPRPAAEVAAIESAAGDLLQPEVQRGRLPDDYESLRLATIGLYRAVQPILTSPISLPQLETLRDAVTPVRELLKISDGC
jgi:hypothetical protein